ncbi:LacI family transcriptional regulator, partial [Pseudomonas aeruginosa]
PAARALASAQSHSVAVLVPSLANLLFIETLEAIHAVLRPQGLAYIGAQLDQRTLLRGEGFRRALQKAGCYDPGLEILTPRPSS